MGADGEPLTPSPGGLERGEDGDALPAQVQYPDQDDSGTGDRNAAEYTQTEEQTAAERAATDWNLAPAGEKVTGALDALVRKGNRQLEDAGEAGVESGQPDLSSLSITNQQDASPTRTSNDTMTTQEDLRSVHRDLPHPSSLPSSLPPHCPQANSDEHTNNTHVLPKSSIPTASQTLPSSEQQGRSEKLRYLGRMRFTVAERREIEAAQLAMETQRAVANAIAAGTVRDDGTRGKEDNEAIHAPLEGDFKGGSQRKERARDEREAVNEVSRLEEEDFS